MCQPNVLKQYNRMSSLALLLACVVTLLAIITFYLLPFSIVQTDFATNKFRFLLQSYCENLRNSLTRSFSFTSIITIIHYLCMHLFIPSWGFGFLLYTDGNFMVVILSILFSLQLHQIIFRRKWKGTSS